MRALFNPNSKVHILLTKVVDLITLNILFILSAVPIITFGTSLLALSKVSLMILEDSYTSVTKEYYLAFKGNLKRGIQLFLFMILSIGLLVACLYFNQLLINSHKIIGLYGILIFSLLLFFVLIYVFPYTARYEDTFINSLKVSLQTSLLNIKVSLKIVIFLTGIFVIALTNNTIFVVMFLILLLMGGPLVAGFISKNVIGAFKKYE